MLSHRVIKKVVKDFVKTFEYAPCMIIYLTEFVKAYSTLYPHVVQDWTENNVMEFLATSASNLEKDIKAVGLLDDKSAQTYMEEVGPNSGKL